MFPLAQTSSPRVNSYFEQMAPSSSPGAQVNAAVDSKLPPAVADKIPRVPESTQELKEVAKEAETKSLAGLRSLVAGGFGHGWGVLVPVFGVFPGGGRSCVCSGAKEVPCVWQTAVSRV